MKAFGWIAIERQFVPLLSSAAPGMHRLKRIDFLDPVVRYFACKDIPTRTLGYTSILVYAFTHCRPLELQANSYTERKKLTDMLKIDMKILLYI